MEGRIYTFVSLIGRLSISEDGHGRVNGVYLPTSNLPYLKEGCTAVLKETEEQINQYLSGDRKVFTVPISIDRVSDFTHKVLEAVADIDYGETRTYSEIAEDIGEPTAYRAVGSACGRNPLPIIIPCHRVVPSSGGTGSYTGGSALKKRLLAHEKQMM